MIDIIEFSFLFTGFMMMLSLWIIGGFFIGFFFILVIWKIIEFIINDIKSFDYV